MFGENGCYIEFHILKCLILTVRGKFEAEKLHALHYQSKLLKSSLNIKCIMQGPIFTTGGRWTLAIMGPVQSS